MAYGLCTSGIDCHKAIADALDLTADDLSDVCIYCQSDPRLVACVIDSLSTLGQT